MIRIGIDITNLDPNYYGGSDTYSRGIIEGLLKLKQKISIQIYINKKYLPRIKNYINPRLKFFVVKKKFIFLQKIYNNFLFIISFLNYKYKIDFLLKNIFNHEFKLIVEKNSDILVCPNVLLPCYNFNIPTLVNIQDIQHVHYPQYFTINERIRRKLTYYNTARFATKIFLSSEFIKKDLKKYYKFLKNDKIFILNEGVDVLKFRKKITKKIPLNLEKFIFFPAQLWPHKNHLKVFEAFEILKNKYNKNINLVLTGKVMDNSEKILKFLKQNKNIHYLGVVDEGHLVYLYQHCLAVLCPSIYESSCLPMLEGFAAKKIIIASDIKPNLEKKKYFKFLIFKTSNSIDLAKKISTIFKQNNKYKIKHNSKKINLFDWRFICMQLYNFIYREVTR